MNTTTETNKLIAKFIGWTERTDPTERWFGCFRNNETLEIYKDLYFDTDWNWLMKVIRKIEQLPDAYDIEEFLLIRDELATGRIETTYDSVVDFIKWYNEQNN